MTSRPATGTVDETWSAGPRPPLRLAVLWFLGNAALNLVWGAIPSVLLAVQLERFDPDAKVVNLAIATGLAALVSVLVQPLAGRLSDATRTRFGKRSPWLVGGAIVGAAAIVAMGFADSAPALIALYLGVVVGINAAGLPLTTTLAERVAPARRGTFSALGAIGQFAGIVGGQALAAALLSSTTIAYVAVAAIAVAVMVVFVVVNPQPDNRDEPAAPVSLRRLLSSFWFNPLAHPDFAWVIAGRVLLGLGFYTVASFNLYILQGYVHLTTEAAASTIPLLSLVSGAAMFVSTLVTGPLSDRLGRRKPFLYVAAAVFAVGLATPFFVPTLTGMFIAQALGGLAFGCMGSVDQALLTQVLPDADDVGKDLGIGAISLNLPQAVAPALAGVVISIAGYGPLFLVGAALAVLGGVSVAFIRSVR